QRIAYPALHSERSAEALSGGHGLVASRVGLECFGDSQLQRMSGEAFCEFDPGRPLSAPLDRGGDYGRLGQTDVRYRRSHLGALRFRELHQQATDGEALVRGPPRAEPWLYVRGRSAGEIFIWRQRNGGQAD